MLSIAIFVKILGIHKSSQKLVKITNRLETRQFSGNSLMFTMCWNSNHIVAVAMSYKLPNGLILMSEILLFEAIVVVTIRYAIRWCYWDTKRRSYKAPAELKSVYRIPKLNIVPCNTTHSNASQIFFNKLYALRNATGEARSQEYVPISIAVLFLPFNAWFIVIGNEQYSVEHMKTCFPFNSLDLFMHFRCYSKKKRTHWQYMR